MSEPMTYTCDACGKVFVGAWSDEEAKAEAEQIWGPLLGSDPAVVCDDCFQRGMARLRA